MNNDDLNTLRNALDISRLRDLGSLHPQDYIRDLRKILSELDPAGPQYGCVAAALILLYAHDYFVDLGQTPSREEYDIFYKVPSFLKDKFKSHEIDAAFYADVLRALIKLFSKMGDKEKVRALSFDHSLDASSRETSLLSSDKKVATEVLTENEKRLLKITYSFFEVLVFSGNGLKIDPEREAAILRFIVSLEDGEAYYFKEHIGKLINFFDPDLSAAGRAEIPALERIRMGDADPMAIAFLIKNNSWKFTSQSPFVQLCILKWMELYLRHTGSLIVENNKKYSVMSTNNRDFSIAQIYAYSRRKTAYEVMGDYFAASYDARATSLGLPSLRAAEVGAAESAASESVVSLAAAAGAGSSAPTISASALVALSREEMLNYAFIDKSIRAELSLSPAEKTAVSTAYYSERIYYVYGSLDFILSRMRADIKAMTDIPRHQGPGLLCSIVLAEQIYRSLFDSVARDEKYRLLQGAMAKLALAILDHHKECADEGFWLSDYGDLPGPKSSIRQAFLREYHYFFNFYKKLAKDYRLAPYALYDDGTISPPAVAEANLSEHFEYLLVKNQIEDLFNFLKAQNKHTQMNQLQIMAANPGDKAKNLKNLSLLCSLVYLGRVDEVLSILQQQDALKRTLGHFLAVMQDSQVIQRYFRLLNLFIDKGYGSAVYALLGLKDSTGEIFANALLTHLSDPGSRVAMYLQFMLRFSVKEQLDIYSERNNAGVNLWENFYAKNGLLDVLKALKGALSYSSTFGISFNLLISSGFKRTFLQHINELEDAPALKWLERQDSYGCTILHCIASARDDVSAQNYLRTLIRLSLSVKNLTKVIEILKIQTQSNDSIGHCVLKNLAADSILLFIDLLKSLAQKGRDADVGFILETTDSSGKSLATYLFEHPNKAIHSAYLLLSHPLLKIIQGKEDEASVTAMIERYKAESEIINRAFLLAASLGKTKFCVLLKSTYGADIDVADHDGNRALHLAILNEHFDTAEQLKILGADLSRRNNDGKVAASYAPHRLREKYRAVEALAFVEHSLLTAINAGAAAASIRIIIESTKPELAIKNQALLLSAKLGATENCSLLVEKGAAIDALDTDGNTALHLALKAGKIETAREIRALKANLSIRNSEGLDAATYAPSDLQELFRTTPSEIPVIESASAATTIAPDLRLDLERKSYEKALKQAVFAVKALLAKPAYAMSPTELIAHYDEVLPFMIRIRELKPTATQELIQIKTLFGVLKIEADAARLEIKEAEASAAAEIKAKAVVDAEKAKAKAAAKAGISSAASEAGKKASAAAAPAGAGAASGKAGYCDASSLFSASAKAAPPSVSVRADDLTHTLRFTALGIGGHLDELLPKLRGGSGGARVVDIDPLVAKAGLLYEVFRLFALFEQRDNAHFLIRRIRNHLCHQYNDHLGAAKNPEVLFELAAYLRGDAAIADLCQYSERLRGAAKADFNRKPLEDYFKSLEINPADRFVDVREAEDILPSVQFALSILAEFNRRLDPMLNKTPETIALGSPVLLAACKMAIMILNDALNDFENKGEQCRLLRNELVNTKCISELELKPVLVELSRLRNRAGHMGGTISMRAGFVIATDDDMNPRSISSLASKLGPLWAHYDRKMRLEAASAASHAASGAAAAAGCGR